MSEPTKPKKSLRKFTDNVEQAGSPRVAKQPMQSPNGQPDFSGLMRMIQQSNMDILRQDQTPVSRISQDQHTQRGTPGLDQWHRNNPNAQVVFPGHNYGQSGPDIPVQASGPAPPATAQNQSQGVPEQKPVDTSLDYLRDLSSAHQAAQEYQRQNQPRQNQPLQDAQTSADAVFSQTPSTPPPALQTAEGFNTPQNFNVTHPAPQDMRSGGDGSTFENGFTPNGQGGLAGLLNIGTNATSLARAPGMMATRYAGGLADIAQNARWQIPQLQNAYNDARQATYAGQKALQAGSITVNELTPAMKAAGVSYKALQSGLGVADTASKVAGRGGKIATMLSGGARLATLGAKLEKFNAPVQAGMMLAEGGRLVFDPAFRKQAAQNYESLGDKGALAGLGQGLESPISTIANSVGGFGDLLSSTTNAKLSNMALNKQQDRTATNTAEVQRLRGQGKSQLQIIKLMQQFRNNH